MQSNETSCVSNKLSLELYDLAEKSVGMSGRSLRKIPFLAHSLYLDKNATTIEDFLQAMQKAIIKQLSDTEIFMTGITPK